MDWSSDEWRQYDRQLLLPEVGPEGQRRLRESSVLVVGVGGLGVPVATYLAAAGVGRIGLVDADVVERSNLHRQVLYGTSSLGRPKVEVAAERLRDLNPFVEIEVHPVRLDRSNALDLIRRYDFVADGTDRFDTRFLVNDACVEACRLNVHASVHRFDGQVSVFGAADGPCYRCLFPEPPPPGLVPSCAEGGVLGVLPGLLGVIQATEVLKLALGFGEPLIGRLLLADARSMRFQTVTVVQDPTCPTCQARSGALPFPSPIPPPMADVPELTVRDLHDMIESGNRPFILDVRSADEYAIANLDGALIPLNELPDRLSELEAHRDDAPLVVHCRSGARSAQAVALLRERGFEHAVNLKGGILAWSDEVDPSVQKY